MYVCVCSVAFGTAQNGGAPVNNVVFSKSGLLMIVAYYFEPFVVVWNTLTGEQLDVLDHRERPSDLRISSDGVAIATACWDHDIRIWKLKSRGRRR